MFVLDSLGGSTVNNGCSSLSFFGVMNMARSVNVVDAWLPMSIPSHEQKVSYQIGSADGSRLDLLV
jgi:hypothetical protein